MNPVRYPSLRPWLMLFASVYGAFVLLPFLAPVLMHANLETAGRFIYLMYSFVCHQLPERSLFLFGPAPMYSLGEIQVAWQNTQDPLILRQFIGNAQMGWKVAWSDRMIAAYGSIWLFGLLWGTFGKRFVRLSLLGAALLALPMALDGATHLLSDLSGLTGGFRYTNEWLAVLTGYNLPAAFYAGDGLGSFNSWMRWGTGLLFGLGLVWWLFPQIDQAIGSPVATGSDPAPILNI